MIQAIYDYWFVQFDFPDEHGRPYKSCGGKMVRNSVLNKEIPVKWNVGNIYTVCDLLNGLACQRYASEYPTDRLPVIKIREMHEGINDHTDYVRESVPEKYLINRGDILFSWSATLDVMIWCGEKSCLNQHIFKITPKLKSKIYVYLLLKELVAHFRKIADARKTTMGHITSEHLQQTMVLIPSLEVMIDFEKMMANIFECFVKSQSENLILSKLRDFLLPLLMNGQVQVRPQGELNYDLAPD